MTTTATTLNPRAIALAHHAGRALLEGVLTRRGIGFEQGVTLRAVAAAGSSIDREDLVSEVSDSLKTDKQIARGVIEELMTAKLLEEDPEQARGIRLSDTGRTLHDAADAETAEISARLYADIPATDLAIAGRVLALITQRANTESANA